MCLYIELLCVEEKLGKKLDFSMFAEENTQSLTFLDLFIFYWENGVPQLKPSDSVAKTHSHLRPKHIGLFVNRFLHWSSLGGGERIEHMGGFSLFIVLHLHIKTMAGVPWVRELCEWQRNNIDVAILFGRPGYKDEQSPADLAFVKSLVGMAPVDEAFVRDMISMINPSPKNKEFTSVVPYQAPVSTLIPSTTQSKQNNAYTSDEFTERAMERKHNVDFLIKCHQTDKSKWEFATQPLTHTFIPLRVEEKQIKSEFFEPEHSYSVDGKHHLQFGGIDMEDTMNVDNNYSTSDLFEQEDAAKLNNLFQWDDSFPDASQDDFPNASPDDARNEFQSFSDQLDPLTSLMIMPPQPRKRFFICNLLADNPYHRYENYRKNQQLQQLQIPAKVLVDERGKMPAFCTEEHQTFLQKVFDG